MLGIELDVVSWREKVLSAVGGAGALLAVFAISHHLLDRQGAAMLLGSIGASAVLLFAVPHGQLSQPWPLLGGHVLSATIGVSCARFIDSQELAAACAVGLAIGAMHQLKAIHPPGGATALTAVMGGAGVRSMGYEFVLQPVLLNVVVMAAFAVAFNAVLPWRRYPAALIRRPGLPVTPPEHEEVLAALRRVDSFLDITEADLVALHRLLNAERTNGLTADG
ncbi:MAG: HPP family protein [Acidimicrobiales bacterium]|nr:HPP family protein [Acidimicrobiales bacterium]